jgi:hypothetical protein
LAAWSGNYGNKTTEIMRPARFKVKADDSIEPVG